MAALYEMIPAATVVVRDILQVQPGEEVLIVTDPGRPQRCITALTSVVATQGGKPTVVSMPQRTVGGEEPPPSVAAAMAAADVTIAAASYALVHTDAFRRAMGETHRLVELWGLEEEAMLHGGLLADYGKVNALTTAVRRIFDRGKSARLTTPAGTDIRVSLEGRRSFSLGGDVPGPGGFTSLPGGEAAIAPVEEMTEGVLVDPFVLERRDMGYRKEPLVARIEGGRIVHVEGGAEARTFAAMLDEGDANARGIGEFAVGTNRWCVLSRIREAKKAWGTAHVGIGNNLTLAGRSASGVHMDIVVLEPTVTVDDVVVVDRGRLVVTADEAGGGAA
jgi:leucyl aminopeptidase (aminopeptidase T)